MSYSHDLAGEVRYQQLFEKAPIGIASANAAGVILAANDQYCALSGCARDGVIGRHFAELLHPEDAEAASVRYREFVESGQTVASYDRRFHRDDGVDAWSSITLSRISDDEVLVVIEDITDRYRAAAELRTGKAQLDEAQGIAHIGSWEYDFASGTRKWSEYMPRLYGLTGGEPFDLDVFFKRMHPDDVQRMRDVMVRAHASRLPVQDRYRVIHDDGSVHTLQVRVRVITDDQGNALRGVGVIQDISERASVEAELHRRAVQQAAVANLGQMALTQTSLAALQWQAVAFVRDVLDADFSHLLQHVDGRFVLVESAGWEESETASPSVEAEGSPAAYAFANATTLVVDDVEHDDRFANRSHLLAAGVRTGVLTPIASSRDVEPWGVLAAFSRTRRLFDNNDINFIRSAATVLAQAMEREAGRRALVESEDRYRSVIEGASEIIFSVAPDGRIVSLNRAFETITGWKCEDWVGRYCVDLVDDSDRPRIAARFEEIQRSGIDITTECRIQGRDRIVLFEITSFSRIRDGQLVGIYGFGRDITESRRIERERERFARNLQLVLDSTVEGIYTMDNAGCCTMINAAAARMLGVDAEEILDADMDATVHTHPIDRNVPAVAEDVFRRRDGTSIPVDYSSAPIYDQGVAIGAVVAFTDVTERRKLELKLEQANRLSSLGRLAATVAHEFNNVLMGIAPFLDVIRRRPSSTAEALDHISRSVTRGKRITQDILRFTQPAEPVLSPLDVEPWLTRVAAEARTLAGVMHHIEVKIDQRNLHVVGDSSQLHQIFINLVLNARDAMPDGGVITIRARREPPGTRFDFGHVEQPERYVHLMVRDTGHGMSPETLRHAFEPLFTTKKSGTGLGLAVTHQVVRYHGGEIFIESAAGSGTTFHVFIPAAQSAEETAAEPMDVPQSVHVLIVEDDETVAAGLECLVELEGMTAEIVSSGAEAIEAVRKKKPAVVLLDVGLPDMDGRNVYASIAALHPDLPVVFSTGHADRGSLDELLDKPHVSFLLKPYDIDSLNEVLRRVLRS